MYVDAGNELDSRQAKNIVQVSNSFASQDDPASRHQNLVMKNRQGAYIEKQSTSTTNKRDNS